MFAIFRSVQQKLLGFTIMQVRVAKWSAAVTFDLMLVDDCNSKYTFLNLVYSFHIGHILYHFKDSFFPVI